MTHFYIGLLHNSNKQKKNTFIGNRSRDFQYDVGKKYALNCANWVQKFKISLRKGALPPCNPRQGALPPGPPPGGQPPGTPVIGQQFGPPLSSGWIRPCQCRFESFTALKYGTWFWMNKIQDRTQSWRSLLFRVFHCVCHIFSCIFWQASS